MKMLIKGGRIVDPVSKIDDILDILIEDGRITRIGSDLYDETKANVIDANGMVVCAGLIDMHVHLRDPGLTYKEDILTGTAAAAHGGFTSVACMPNTKPVTDNAKIIGYILDKAKQGSGTRVLPIGAVSVGEKGQEMTDFAELKNAGAVALSDDGVPIMNANLMRDALIKSSRQKMTILCHEEDINMVKNYAVNEGRVSRQLNLPGRPAIAEEIMIMRDAMLAEETGQPVHICHISTAKGVDIVRRYKHKGVKITCETCPQYFTLTHEQVLLKGTMARVNPPLRTSTDVAGILNGLKDGTIDCIVTDHAPHSAEEKNKSLEEAPSGMVGLETSLAITLTALYHTGEMSLSDIISKMTVNPAKILNVNYGSMGIGRIADLTIFNPDEEWIVNPSEFKSKGRNTPFAGMTVKGKVKYTIVGGKVIYSDH